MKFTIFALKNFDFEEVGNSVSQFPIPPHRSLGGTRLLQYANVGLRLRRPYDYF